MSLRNNKVRLVKVLSHAHDGFRTKARQTFHYKCSKRVLKLAHSHFTHLQSIELIHVIENAVLLCKLFRHQLRFSVR